MKRLTYPFALSVFWLIVIGYIFNATLPVVSGGSFSQKMNTLSITPQGWGFFTKDTREEQLIVYQLGKGGDIQKFTKTNSSLSSFFGLSRKTRFIAMEAAHISAKISDTLWRKMEGGKLILDKNAPTDTLTNFIKPTNLVGDFFFVVMERIPWAWAGNDIVMPYKYAKVHVHSNSK